MKKKRINNDLNIRWELYDKNGNNLDLSNIAIDFKIIHATTRRAFIPIFSTENNIIISQFPAINQLKLGKYYLYCCLRNTDITVEGGIATYTFDSNDVFELVEKTALEDEFNEIAIYSNIEVTAGGNIGGGSLTEPQKQWIGEGKTLINGATSLPEGINMNTEELTKKAPINHNHDYAPSDHNHNELYAPKSHTHTDLLKKPDTDGTAGQVLTITEAGLQWKTPSSTGGGESIPGSGLTEEQKAFLGTSGDLQTEAKDSLPKAINEVSNKVESLGQEVGQLNNSPYTDFDIMDKINGVWGMGIPIKSVNTYDCTNKRLVVYQYSKSGNHYGMVPLFLSSPGLEIGFKRNGYNLTFTVKKDNVNIIEDISLIEQADGIIGGIKEGTLIAEIDFEIGYYSLKHTSDNRINFSGFIPELINLEIVANIEFTAFHYASETYYTYIAFGKKDYSTLDNFIPSVGSGYPNIPFSEALSDFDKIKPNEVTSDGDIKGTIINEVNLLDRTFTLPATPTKRYITLATKALNTFSAVTATSIHIDMIEGTLVLYNGTGSVEVYNSNNELVSDKTLRPGNTYVVINYNNANRDHFYNSKFNSNGSCETDCKYRIYKPKIHVHQSAMIIPKFLQPNNLLFKSDIPFKLESNVYKIITKPSNILKSDMLVDQTTALVGQHVIVGEDAYITTYSGGLYKYKKITI